MEMSMRWKGSTAQPGVSRPGPLKNRLLLLIWMAQREDALSLPLCVSSPLVSFCILVKATKCYKLHILGYVSVIHNFKIYFFNC